MVVSAAVGVGKCEKRGKLERKKNEREERGREVKGVLTCVVCKLAVRSI